MIVRTRFDWYVILYNTWVQATASAVIAALVVILDLMFDRAHFSIPLAYMGLLGTAIALVLTFKNNQAYDRWWEARIQWGALVNDSRSLARQALHLGTPGGDQPWRERLVRRQLAFVNALRLQLRGRGDVVAIAEHVPPDELEALKQAPNVAAALLDFQSREVARARASGELDGYGQLLFEENFVRLSNALGACERIKKTPFPRQYDDFAQVIVFLFCLLFPFSLVRDLGLWTIPASVVVAYAFQVLDGVGRNIQDPFEGTVHDTPMATLCRTIERDLLFALGEAPLPEPLSPRRGVLM
jgi:putative membrane protein